MTRILHFTLLPALALLLIGGAPRAQFHGHMGGLQVHHAWVRATPPGVTVTAMYGTIVNPTDAPARLVGVSCALADAVEIHQEVQKEGMMHMQPVPGGLAIPARSEFSLSPGGFHLMLIGLHAPLKPGETVPLAFRFADGKEVEVLAIASAEGGGMHGEHGHHDAPGMPHGHDAPGTPHGHDTPGMPHGHDAPAMPHGHDAPGMPHGHHPPGPPAR